jgi:DNA-binding NtrC family response regulator
MGLLLLIDDDPGIRYSFQRAFGDEYEVLAEGSGAEGLAALEEHADEVDLVLLDIRMPGMDGFSVLEQARRAHPNVPVVMVTAYSDTETAIQAMRRGAYEYLVKPFDTDRVRALVEAARKQRALTRASVLLGGDDGDQSSPADRLVGGSPQMIDVYKQIGQVAATELPCLITGPTGSGKELVARAVVQHGARADRSFLVVDCASIPHDLLEAELFGYEEGSFTGARRGGKIGKFELCHGGTLFLDEIGDLPLDLQAKFLRALQTGVIQRV